MVLGAVVRVTGGGLFADMEPFRAGADTFGLVLIALPCLLLNYLGRGHADP
ncbi:hypothetical protein [Maridesulfovibrio sp.]|uniref:hypothetical protein n=1 Tax=Maridesulfovibrio sp. TaxID=2795000 RepID=UPI003AFF6222